MEEMWVEGARNEVRKSRKKVDKFYIVNVLLLGIWALVIIYPFYNSILVSLVSQKEYIRKSFMLWPKEITFDAYKFILGSPKFYYGYRNTIIILLLGVPYNMILSLGVAYALAKESFPGKRIINSLIIFTMYFSGGMIPFYLLIKRLGLMDSLAAVILPYGVNTFYMLVMSNYFRSIPASIEESAKIDGANEIIILFKIILPISMPIIATFILFFSVDRWNEWFNAMLFIRSGKRWPLQMVLRSIILTTIDDLGGQYASLRRTVFPSGVRMAAIVVTMVPIMLVYPFLQKYFMKGILVGAIKS